MEMQSSVGNRSVEDTAKQFQVYLRKYENDEKLEVSEVVDKPGSKLGDNYTSVMIRTKVTGTRGDGSSFVKSFMGKTLCLSRPIAEFLELSNLFHNEAHMYKKVLPTLSLGSFGPDCIHTDKGNIIMEDLAEKGYVNCERRNFLDLDHTIFTLKALAKLHASALAVKIKNPSMFEEMAAPLKEVIYYEDNTTPMVDSAEMATKMTISHLEMIEPKTQEIQDVIDHLSPYVDKSYNALKRLFNAPKEKYHTICHGDPWTNNLLFLHDQDGKVVDLKMVDYQIGRHISVATDIHYFIYSSVQSSLIEKSYESLIRIYHNALLNELRLLDVDENIFAEIGLDWLKAELQTYMFFGMLTGCWIVHPILADDEDVLLFEQIDPKELQNFDVNLMKVSEKKLERIKCIALHYYRRYYLGIIKDDIEPIFSDE